MVALEHCLHDENAAYSDPMYYQSSSSQHYFFIFLKLFPKIGRPQKQYLPNSKANLMELGPIFITFSLNEVDLSGSLRISVELDLFVL
jgi:hypothetical protein